MFTPEKQTLLIVEDEAAIGKLCFDVLSSRGYDVELAPNGKKAMQKMMCIKYDLYLIDIRLPGISGKELYNFLATNRIELVNRVAFITGDTISEDVIRFVTESGQPLLPKPFTPSELVSFVGKCFPGSPV